MADVVDLGAVAVRSEMDVVRADLRPDPDLDREGMTTQQRAVAQAATFRDEAVPDPGGLEIDGPASRGDGATDAPIVVGIDQAFTEATAVSVAVALQDGDIVDTATGRAAVSIPYIPGLLSYREAGAILAALTELSVTPDLLVLDGSGRIHYRQAGIAVHVGVLYDVPTIGVAKTLLCGDLGASLTEPLSTGRRIPITADDDVEPVVTEDPDWPLLGFAYQSRQYGNPEHQAINPVYVSPGHRISAGTAVDAVAATVGEHKLPEPIRVADRRVSELVSED